MTVSENIVIEQSWTVEEWLEARRKGIGASEAAALMGMSLWADPLSVYVDKVAPVEERDHTPWILQRGHAMEGPVADEYARVTGREIMDPGDSVQYYHKDLPLLRATPDRIIVATDVRPAGVLECKSSLVWKIPYFGDDDGEEDSWFPPYPAWKDAPPDHVLIQVQHQLAATGLTWGSVAVDRGSEWKYFDIERDEEVIKMIAAVAGRFWRDHVLAGVPPEPCSGDASARAIAALYPNDSGATMMLHDDIRDKWLRRVEVSAQIKALEAEKSGLTNDVKAALKDCSFGESGDVRVSNKLQRRKGSLSVDVVYADQLEEAGISYKAKKATAFRVLRKAAKKGKK